MAALPKPKAAAHLSGASPSARGRKPIASAARSPSKAAPEGEPVAAAKAKAHFAELLAQVEQDRKPILISRRGKVVAQLIPAPEVEKISNFDRVFGSMRGTVTITGDIVSPDWEAWGPEWR